MRHYNPTHTSYWHHSGRPYVCDKPYCCKLTYTRPTSKSWYIKILQYIYDHPNCKRAEIKYGIFPKAFPTLEHAKKNRGYACCVFANMLYDNLIDYDKSFRYTITDYGKKILKSFYMQEMAKTVLN